MHAHAYISGTLLMHSQFKGVLIHDVESAELQKAVETVEIRLEEIRLRIEKDSEATEAAREVRQVNSFRLIPDIEFLFIYLFWHNKGWRSTSMVDIDSIVAAEERIFKLRLDPEIFPSANMKGEVVKSRAHFECQGTLSDRRRANIFQSLTGKIGTTFDVFKAVWLNRKWVAAKRFRGREYQMTDKQDRVGSNPLPRVVLS